MSEVKHTSTPWSIFNKSRVLAIMASDETKEVIHWAGFDSSSFPNQNLANAELIVTAVNNHAELIKALEQIEGYALGNDNGAIVMMARQALAKARGK